MHRLNGMAQAHHESILAVREAHIINTETGEIDGSQRLKPGQFAIVRALVEAENKPITYAEACKYLAAPPADPQNNTHVQLSRVKKALPRLAWYCVNTYGLWMPNVRRMGV